MSNSKPKIGLASNKNVRDNYLTKNDLKKLKPNLISYGVNSMKSLVGMNHQQRLKMLKMISKNSVKI